MVKKFKNIFFLLKAATLLLKATMTRADFGKGFVEISPGKNI